MFVPESRQKSENLRARNLPHEAIEVWWRALQTHCWCWSHWYTSIIPNNLYIAPTWDILPLDGQTCLEVGRKSRFFPDLRQETPSTKSMTEGLTIMLEVFLTLLYTYPMPIIYYSTFYMLLYPPWWPNMSKNWLDFRDLYHETCQQKAIKVGWRDLQACWGCSSPYHTPIQCQSTTIVAVACCRITPLDGQTCLRVDRKLRFFSSSETWYLPIWGCKSMMEGPTIMLKAFINLLYTYTVRNDQYTSMQVMPYCRLATKYFLKVGLIVRSWPVWGYPSTKNWLQKYDRGPYIYAISIFHFDMHLGNDDASLP